MAYRRNNNNVQSILQDLSIKRTKKAGRNSSALPHITYVSDANRGEGFETNNPVFKYMEFDEVPGEFNATDIDVPTQIRPGIPIVIPYLPQRRSYKTELKMVLYFWNGLYTPTSIQTNITRYLIMCAGVMDIMFYNSGRAALNTILKAKNEYAPTHVELTDEEVNMLFDEETTTNGQLLEIYNQACTSDLSSLGVSTILSGLIMVLIGKSINLNVSDSWFMSRYRALASKSGYGDGLKILTDLNIIPNRELCAAFNATVSGHFEFRKTMFERLRGVRYLGQKQSDVCGIIMDYLAWTEMTHIDIIVRYVLEKYPELMSMRTLSVFQRPLDRAFTYIKSKPANDQKWIKILYPNSESHVLNSQNFTTLTAVARHIASKFRASFLNYAVQHDAIATTIFPIIDVYLNNRGLVSSQEIANSLHVAAYAELERLDEPDISEGDTGERS